MYRFIIGGSGSGKTYKALNDCISAATADEGSHFLLLVPEQSTTATEKETVRLHPRHATDNIDVLSFSRLAYRVFSELGIDHPKVIDDISKAMIIRKIGAEHEAELKVWKNRFDKPGFVDNLKSMISELYLYGISPEELAESIGKVDGQLRGKMHDLSLIYGAFKTAIKDKYVTLEEIPDILAVSIHKSNLIKNAYIVLDGFTGFTPIQYRIIESFLCYAREVVVTVSMGEDRDSDLFDMSREMINRIIDTASKNGVSHGEDIILKNDNFLEKHFLRYDGAKGKVEKVKTGDDSIRIVHALTSADESAFISNDIERLVKTCGYRYKDIAVVTADISRYKSILNHEMDLAGIPYYVDESIGIADNPLVGMIEAVFDIMHTDYSYDSVMRYLKSSLVSDDEEMIFVMDNYMYECGRRGYKRMLARWDYIPKDLSETDRDELNRFKDGVLSGLEELKELIYGDKKVGADEITSAVIKLFEHNNVSEKLEKMRADFEASGDASRAREYAEIYDRVINLLNDISALLEGEKLSGQEYKELFMTGASQIKLGMIPSGTDRITIGDITRSRLEGIKVLYVAGANDGSIPKLLSRGNVITDSEKERLKEVGFELSPTVREDLMIQKFYLYRLFTKPGDELIISYAGLDQSGNELKPSYIINYMTGMYENLKVSEASDVSFVYDVNAAVKAVAGVLRDLRTGEKTEMTDGLYAYLSADEITRERVKLITGAALYEYKPEKLSKETVDLLYGDDLSGSVSKLEKFAQCPYGYFATYGLGLKEIEAFTFRAMDIGNIAHSALEKIFTQADKLSIDLAAADDDARKAMVHRCIEEAILDDESAKYSDTARNEYMVGRVEKVVARSLWGLLQNLHDGYTPYEFEWSFGKKDRISSATFDLGDGKKMQLSGKIDRTDIKDEAGEVAVRIIDYKSGSKDFSLSDIVNGNDLQITLYMAAAQELLKTRMRGKSIVPSEMYYYPLRDPILDKEKIGKKEPDEAMKAALKPSGVSSKKEVEKLIPYVGYKAEGYGKRIAGGEIGVSPVYRDERYTGCSFCKFRAVCGFDRKIDGFKYNTQKKFSNDEAWQIIDGQVNSQTP